MFDSIMIGTNREHSVSDFEVLLPTRNSNRSPAVMCRNRDKVPRLRSATYSTIRGVALGGINGSGAASGPGAILLRDLFQRLG